MNTKTAIKVLIKYLLSIIVILYDNNITMIKKLFSTIFFVTLTAWCMQATEDISLQSFQFKPDVTNEKSTNDCLTDNKEVTVYKAIDWDTISFYCGWESYKVRIIWIDTPETKHPSKPVQCFWIEASNKMKELVEGKKIILVQNKSSWNTDKYWRLLRYIFIWDTDIGKEMINKWYAFSYKRFPHSKLDEYNEIETIARNNNTWLWDENTCDY